MSWNITFRYSSTAAKINFMPWKYLYDAFNDKNLTLKNITKLSTLKIKFLLVQYKKTLFVLVYM